MERSGRKQHIVLWAAFGLYAAALVWLVLLSRESRFVGGDYWQQVVESIHLEPLATIRRYTSLPFDPASKFWWIHAGVNLLGNVIVFVPLGWFLPALWRKQRNFFRFTLTVSGLILLIELAQLLTFRGICDVDDFLLNLPGAILGFLLWYLFRKP